MDADIVEQIIGVRGYIQAVTFLLTVFAPTVMVAYGAPRRDKFALRFILCVVGLVAFFELFTLMMDFTLRNNSEMISYILYFLTLKFFCTFVLCGVSIKIIYNVDVWTALFCATAGYCLQHIQAKIGSILTDFILTDMFWVVETLMNVSFAVLFYALFYFLFLRKMGAPHTVNHVQIAIAACVVGVNIFYNSFGLSYLGVIMVDMQSAGLETVTADRLTIFIHIMSMLVAVLALALDFGMSINKRLEDEKDALNKILEEGKRQYEYEKKNIEMINMKCHDLKHQLAAMKGKIYEEQIEELSEAVSIYDSSIKTGNEALDVLFTQKSFYCAHHGIRLTCLIDGENYGFIPRHELYSLFNNAIDNAIEAVEKLPEEKRVISLTESVSAGVTRVRVENYYSGTVDMKDGLPRSSKGTEGHGYGVKSIKLIAEKNGGGISIETTGETFVLNIFFGA